MNQLASSTDSVRDAICRYNKELKQCRDLVKRMPLVRSWYAIQEDDGNWKFGPSKWVGYEGLDANTYLNQSNRTLDGRETEARLREWFRKVKRTEKLYGHLSMSLTAFLANYDKSPNKLVRINVCKDVRVD